MHPERVQILGSTEISYLESLAPGEARHGIETFLAMEPGCIIVTKGLALSGDLVEACNRTAIPLMRTEMLSSRAIELVQQFLEHEIAPRTNIHGVPADVLGIGVLLLGKSGVGKSEAALELIMRGHRLIADDLVEVRRKGPNGVFGYPSELLEHHMEIRGVGIINIKDMFGVAAVRDEKKIKMVMELQRLDEFDGRDRLGGWMSWFTGSWMCRFPCNGSLSAPAEMSAPWWK